MAHQMCWWIFVSCSRGPLCPAGMWAVAPAILIQTTIQPRLPTSQPARLQSSNLQSTSSLAMTPLPLTKSTQGMVPDPSTVSPHKASSMPFFPSSRARTPVSVISTTLGLLRSWSYSYTSLVSPLKSQRFPNFPRLSCHGFFSVLSLPLPTHHPWLFRVQEVPVPDARGCN